MDRPPWTLSWTGIEKGDVLGTARIAGIMAAKRTSELIPMCHPIAITSVEMDFEADRKPVEHHARGAACPAAPASRWRP